MKKHFVIVISALAALSLFVGASVTPSADEIIAKARSAAEAKSMTCKASMLITSKSGTVTERAITQAYLTEGGLTKSVIVFLKPESVRDTRFLIVENADGSSDRWIYLPSARKVRRISADEGSGSFMGSDFTYDDLAASGKDEKTDTHKLVGEGDVAGSPVWIIESVPKPGSSSQYSKTISYVDKTNYLIRKAEMFDKKGKLLKTLEITGYAKIGGYWTTLQMVMKNVQEGSSTKLSIDESSVAYDKALSPKIFTLSFLETGKY